MRKRNNNPKISVIVPVYNVERYLYRCVNSILAQTFVDFELILINDGSSDKCPSICDEYSAQDSRVKVIHQKNGGAAAARNAGIRVMQGEYVCFIDGDDFVHPDFLSMMYQQMKDSDAIFSTCSGFDFNDYDEVDGLSYDSDVTAKISTYLQFFQDALEPGGYFSVCCKLFRKEVIEQIHFMEGKICEDISFLSDLLAFQDRNVVLGNHRLYYRLLRAGGVMGSQGICNPDFIDAGVHMIHCVNQHCPQLLPSAVKRAMSYPWSFVDGIYVRREFKENKVFLKTLQNALRQPIVNRNLAAFTPIVQHRMRVFAYSKVLFGMNAFLRLIRLYCYRLLGKDPYKDGHGI